MTDTQFASVAEIDRAFQVRLDAAPEENKLSVELDHQKAVRAFMEGEQSRNQVRTLRDAALTKFPLARPNELSGATEAEIEASAKASHEAVQTVVDAALEKQKTELEEAAARRGYAGGAGGGARPVPAGDDALFAEIDQKMADGTLTVSDRPRVEEYTRRKFRLAVQGKARSVLAPREA